MEQPPSLRSNNYIHSVLAPFMDTACPAAELSQGRLSHVGDTKPHKQPSLQIATDGKTCRCTHHASINSQHIKDCHLMHRQVNCIFRIHLYRAPLFPSLFLLRIVPQLHNKRAGAHVKLTFKKMSSILTYFKSKGEVKTATERHGILNKQTTLFKHFHKASPPRPTALLFKLPPQGAYKVTEEESVIHS